MSGILDKLILDDVAKTCTDSFLAYNNCVLQPPPTKDFNPAKDCLKFQWELQKCIKEEVPSFQKIQLNCTDKIKNYESCLLKNQGDAASKCSDQLVGLRECAEDQLGISDMK